MGRLAFILVSIALILSSIILMINKQDDGIDTWGYQFTVTRTGMSVVKQTTFDGIMVGGTSERFVHNEVIFNMWW